MSCRNNKGKKCKRGPAEISRVIGHAITLKTKEMGMTSSVNYLLPFCHCSYWDQDKVLGKCCGNCLVTWITLHLDPLTRDSQIKVFQRRQIHANFYPFLSLPKGILISFETWKKSSLLQYHIYVLKTWSAFAIEGTRALNLLLINSAWKTYWEIIAG